MNCSTALSVHRNSPRMNRAGEVFSPAVLLSLWQYRRRGTATSRLPAAIGEQGGAEPCSAARIPCGQSEPLEGNKKSPGDSQNSPAASSPDFLFTGTTSSHSPGMSTQHRPCCHPTLRAASTTGARQQQTVGQIRPKPGFHTFVCLLFQSTVYT